MDNEDERLLELESKKEEIEDMNKKRDAQRKMSWISLFGMLLYPFLVILAVFLGLDGAANILGSMAGTYFVSVAAIVMGFFGSEAYKDKN